MSSSRCQKISVQVAVAAVVLFCCGHNHNQHTSAFVPVAPHPTLTRPASSGKIATVRSQTRYTVATNANTRDKSSFSLGECSRIGGSDLHPRGIAAIAARTASWGRGDDGWRKRFEIRPLHMSTMEVTEGGGGGDGATMTTVAEEFDVKTDLLNQIDLATSSKKRTAVNELMLKLEPMNPTDTPARSALLNGVWEFLYTGGLSPGTLAVQVLSRVAKRFSAVVDLKGVTLTVKRDQPRVEAAVKASLFGTEVQVKVRTRLEQCSDMRLQEVYEQAEVGGVTIPIPARVQPRRTLFITYLDDDILVARDDSGAPDLLIRKDKEFRFNTGTPSATEDDSSPGSG